MIETPSNGLLENTKLELAKLLARVDRLQKAYIFLLTAERDALQEAGELKKALDDLNQRLKADDVDSAQYFVSIMFVDLISAMEIYFASIIKAAVCNYPKKLNTATFKLSEIVDSASTDELITRAAEEHVYRLMYKKPHEYLADMCDLLSIDANNVINWTDYIEAKARRDLGTHNNWKCNGTYLKKLKDAGLSTDAKVDDSMVPLYDDYVGKKLDQLAKLAFSIAFEVEKKHA